jgi:hypothetical protein
VAPKAPAGLFAPPKRDEPPPPKGVDVLAVLVWPNPPKPVPVAGAAVVDEPKRPPPVVVAAAPKAGLAPKALLV